MKDNMYFIPMPKKPKFSRKALVYLIIASLFLVVLYLSEPNPDSEQIEAMLGLCGILIGIPFAIFFIIYIEELLEYNSAQSDFEEYKREKIDRYNRIQEELDREYEAAVASQKSTVPWAVRYSTTPCPYCGRFKVRDAKVEDIRLSPFTVYANYKCDSCGKLWE